MENSEVMLQEIYRKIKYNYIPTESYAKQSLPKARPEV